LRVAVDWSCATRNHKLAQALVRPVAAEISLRSQHEIGDWAEQILDVTPLEDEELTAFWVTCAAHRYQQTRDQEAYERLVRRHGSRTSLSSAMRERTSTTTMTHSWNCTPGRGRATPAG
jgi:hypothetical protein